MKKPINRLAHSQPDYLLLIVRQPEGWRPRRHDDVPPISHVLSVSQVASYEEAQDDLLRCNQLASRHHLKQWAIIHAPNSDS
jgi:hypothetical protein